MNAKKSRDKQARELRDRIAKATGISNSKALEIAEAAVRGRNLDALSRQKSWPVEWDAIVGPVGIMPLALLAC